MPELKQVHWTERSLNDFVYRLSADFIRQLEQAMAGHGDNKVALANKLGVSKGRVSQLINNPGNMTLRKMIEYSRALGKKISVVMYDDGDHANTSGPISSQVFTACWENAGKPTDFFSLRENTIHTFVLHPSGHRFANESYNMWHNDLPLLKEASTGTVKRENITVGK
jgi:hypothetical protein